jgi:hypothetical protein
MTVLIFACIVIPIAHNALTMPPTAPTAPSTGISTTAYVSIPAPMVHIPHSPPSTHVRNANPNARPAQTSKSAPPAQTSPPSPSCTIRVVLIHAPITSQYPI